MQFCPHTQRLGDILPLLTRTRPEFCVAIDPDPASAEAACKLTKLIIRHYGPWDNGESQFDLNRFIIEVNNAAWLPYAWAVETPNEPHPGNPELMEAVVTHLRVQGKECVVGNWGTGWSGFYVPGATYYGAHEYGTPTVLSQSPWHALRYRRWFPAILQHNPEAKLLITECGVTQAVDGGPDVGWRSGGRSAALYAAELAAYQYELTQDPYVLAAAVFQFGGVAPWESFGCENEPALEALLGNPLQPVTLPPGFDSGGVTPPEVFMTRPSDIQAIIDFNRGLATLLKQAATIGKGKNLKATQVKTYQEQAAFSAEHLEAHFPNP